MRKNCGFEIGTLACGDLEKFSPPGPPGEAKFGIWTFIPSHFAENCDKILRIVEITMMTNKGAKLRKWGKLQKNYGKMWKIIKNCGKLRQNGQNYEQLWKITTKWEKL